MPEHLSTQKVERYRKLLMSPGELLEADDHVAQCETCRLLLLDEQRARSAFSSARTELRAVARAKPEHTSYEALASYVDGEADEVDREIVKSHLEMCAACAAEARDLLVFKAALANETEASMTTQAASQARAGGRKPTASWWRLPFGMSPLQAAGTAFVALLFAGIIAAVWLRRETASQSTPTELARQVEQMPVTIGQSPATQQPTPVAPVNNQPSNANQSEALQPTAPSRERPTPRPAQRLAPPSSQNETLALNDGAERITLDREGNVKGLESLPPSYQEAARRALTMQSVETSPALSELGGRGGTLMGGGSSSGVSFPVLSPVGMVVRSERPVFRWGQLEGATGYSVKVYDANLRKVADSPLLSGTEWKSSQPLVRGGVYVWQVTAKRDEAEVVSPAAPAPEAKFKVLDEAHAAELEQAEQKYPDSHLTMGLLYARAGLLEDAEREFQALVRVNPDSQVARKLLRDAQAKRRR
ncbi:MAG: zf-HC2 domain-containing protein [Pyrinomonadaceae bacterium]